MISGPYEEAPKVARSWHSYLPISETWNVSCIQKPNAFVVNFQIFDSWCVVLIFVSKTGKYVPLLGKGWSPREDGNWRVSLSSLAVSNFHVIFRLITVFVYYYSPVFYWNEGMCSLFFRWCLEIDVVMLTEEKKCGKSGKSSWDFLLLPPLLRLLLGVDQGATTGRLKGKGPFPFQGVNLHHHHQGAVSFLTCFLMLPACWNSTLCFRRYDLGSYYKTFRRPRTHNSYGFRGIVGRVQ